MKIAPLLILSLLIPALAAATISAPAMDTVSEACSLFEHTWTYYSDATKTQIVGERYRNDRTGYTYSWGTITAYFDYVKVPICEELAGL